MSSTYRAMQISRPGVLELVERALPVPQENEVLIAVEACGVCGADINDIDNPNTQMGTPRVPGHEVVGRILSCGKAVSERWQIGQRVGVGRLGGQCNECAQCRQGKFQLCLNQQFVGSSCDGGYAELMLAKSTGLISIPDELSSVEAAPILCAGLSTFNALRRSGAQAGDTVAILGTGGLGHMAVQYARKMGFRVVAIGRREDVRGEVEHLGAHLYIDSSQTDAIEKLKGLGGAHALVTTITSVNEVSPYLNALVPQGKLVILGVGKTPLSISTGHLVSNEKSIVGSMTGTPYDCEKALNFSVLFDVVPKVETMPMCLANDAIKRLKSGGVKFRMVLTMRKDASYACT